MIASNIVKKPANWQDFEKLCKKLWGEIWECSDTIRRNGRSGQKQNGVDVYGIPKGKMQYYGIQCKGKDDYSNSVLTTQEVDEELQKVECFKPNLKCLIFATTANKDAKIEEYIRCKNIEYQTKGLFEVYLACWEDIVDLLEERKSTYNWYINNCQYKDNTDIKITFNGEDELIIYPEYIRTKINYRLGESNYSKWNHKFSFPIVGMFNNLEEQFDLNEQKNKNIQYSEIQIKIENIGTTVIEDYKLYLGIDKRYVEYIDTGVDYPNDIYMSSSSRMEIYRMINESREVYESEESLNELVYIPNNSILVQSDRRFFKFIIGLKYGINTIPVNWNFKSRDYKKDGMINIIVIPRYEEKTEIKYCSELREPEVRIEAKMLDENEKE